TRFSRDWSSDVCSSDLDNLVENTRYGVHYMYSHRNRLRSNRALRNGGGFALMQSRGIVALDNEAHDNVETGILFRDAQRCTISRSEERRVGKEGRSRWA